jgi:trans-aconitate methyltransferase
VSLRLPSGYFEAVYAAGDDPWSFDTSWYERRKYGLTVAALPRPHYRRVFEPGCANGALTELLAARCDELVALELVPSVAARARSRLASRRHVTVREGAIPEDWPDGRFDLVVLSEVAYYLTEQGWTALAGRLTESLDPGAHVVAVHWTGETDYPSSGHEVHERLRAQPALRCLAHHEDERFLLTVLETAVSEEAAPERAVTEATVDEAP